MPDCLIQILRKRLSSCLYLFWFYYNTKPISWMLRICIFFVIHLIAFIITRFTRSIVTQMKATIHGGTLKTPITIPFHLNHHSNLYNVKALILSNFEIKNITPLILLIIIIIRICFCTATLHLPRFDASTMCYICMLWYIHSARNHYRHVCFCDTHLK